MSSRFFSAESLRIQTYLFTVTLPILEAPKNLFIVTALVCYLGIKLKRLPFPKMGFVSKAIFLLLLMSSLLPIFWAPVGIGEFLSDSIGWVKYLLFAVVVAGLFAEPAHHRLLLWAIVLGLALAIVHSAYEFYTTGATYPELKSVGHVNQSAIYLCMGLIIAMFLWLAEDSIKLASLPMLVAVLGCVLLVPMRSMIATAAVGLALPVLFLAMGRNYRGISLIFLLGVFTAALSFTPSGVGFISEWTGRITGADLSSKRIELFNAAWLVSSADGFLGSGIRSFGDVVTADRVSAILSDRGEPYVSSDYFYSNHGHGLWTTTLVERGLLGWLAFLALGLTVVHRLIRAPSAEAIGLVGALGVFIAAVSMGNTTFHNEHGGLALLVFFVFLNSNFPVISRHA